MKFTYKKHNYQSTPIGYWIEKFVFEKPLFKSTVSFISHGDGCCDYWTPIDSTKAKRALMLDDNLALKDKTHE